MSRTLSVVIPAKDEELRLGRTLARLRDVAPRLGITEVVIVDDGSRDRTPDLVREAAAAGGGPVFRLEQHERNRGKAASLRTGMLGASGDLIALFDADLSVDPAYLEGALRLIEGGADVVTGTRIQEDGTEARGSQPLFRRAGSRLFRFMQEAIVGLPFRDTQCPFKVMTRDVRDGVVPRLTIDRWNFDVEFLVVAMRQGFAVRELPVVFEHVEGSTVRMTPGYFIEQPRALWAIRRRHGSARRRDRS